jgi:hypothetical protein
VESASGEPFRGKRIGQLLEMTIAIAEPLRTC